MNSFRDLTAITFAEEVEGMRIHRKDSRDIAYFYRQMMKEYPNLQKFLDCVREHSGQSAVATLWRRIWYAIESERQLGNTDTIDLLLQLPDMDDRIVEPPSPDCPKPLAHYLAELDRLVRSSQKT